MTAVTSSQGPQAVTSQSESPYQLIARVSRIGSSAILIATAEGTARFVADASASKRQRQRGLPSAFRALSEMCGFGWTMDDLEGIILSGPPVRVLVVGEKSSTDADAFDSMERMGITRAIGPQIDETKIKDAAGFDAIFDRCIHDDAEALVVLIPPGVLPAWAAHFFTALWAFPSREAFNVIVLASTLDVAQFLPPGTRCITRRRDLTSHLADALAAVIVERQRLNLPPGVRAVWRTQSLVTAVLAAQQAHNEPICYLDVADGALLIIADQDHAQIAYDPDLDIGFGAVTALERLDVERIQRWLPWRIDAQQLRQWALRRVSWPEAMLTETSDRAVAGAFVRAALSSLIAHVPSAVTRATRVLLGPGFLQWGSRDEALHVVADILPPGTHRQVAFDADDLLEVVGYLARFHPASAAALFERDALDMLGTVISIPGASHPRTITVTDTETLISVNVSENSTLQLPITGDAVVRVESGDRDAQTSRVVGGSCGILIDTRSRPLTLTRTVTGTRESVSNRLRPHIFATGNSHD